MAKIFQPTLVIGLGGTGKNIIVALKKMIAENSPNGMADYPLLRFLSIDTDTAIPNVHSAIQTIEESELTLNKEQECFSLHTDFNAVPDLKNFKEINSWFPDSLKHSLAPAELEKGAGQRKPIGRFSFAWNAEELRKVLFNILSNPVDVNTGRQFEIGSENLNNYTNIFICGSICGGTGSGTFLDVAYLVRYVASTITHRQFFIYGMFALASIFDNIQGGINIRTNCYASLVELDHFMNPINYNNEYRRFFPAYKNISSDRWNYSSSANIGPFDYPFLFDNTNSKGISLNSSKAFSEMVARFIYILTGHEVSKEWKSMDSNVRTNIDTNYEKSELQKPNGYRAMGTYSIMFPSRMAIQMCAYKLADVYLDTILDDSYSPEEITNLVNAFMRDTKFNPTTDLLKSLFDTFEYQDISSGSFSQFLEDRKEEFLDECEDCDKKDLVQKVREWRESMDNLVMQFKLQNASKAKYLREQFLSYLNKKISDFLDLTNRSDDVNKIDGEPKMVRGSIVRAQKFVKALIEVYTNAAVRFKREEDSKLTSINDIESDYRTQLEDLEDSIDSFLSSKKKILGNLEDTVDLCVDYLNTKRESFISGWCYQLFKGIKEAEIVRYKGIIDELEAEEQLLQSAVNDFNSIHSQVKNYIENNKNFESSSFCDILFDYDEDVEGVYKKLLEEKGEDFIFQDLSIKLKDKQNCFGDSYENLKNMTSTVMLITILRCTEEYFKEPISKINIADKLLNNQTALNLLTNGNYYGNASCYLGLDGAELSKDNLDLSSSEFFAITIPDVYDSCPCKEISGVIKGSQSKCPVDRNPENYKGEKSCPNYPNCLKRYILQKSSENLAIIPTSETSEINIITTIAGYPLHAVPSIMVDCKGAYKTSVDRANQNKLKGEENEETIHMFGTVKFEDLGEKTENPLDSLDEFKKTVILAIALGRLVIHPLSVKFITKNDIDINRRDNPSLYIGTKIEDIYGLYQSTRISDIKTIKIFIDEMNELKGKVRINEKMRESLGEKLKSSFEELSANLPIGVSYDDLILLNDVTKELCGFELIKKNTDAGYW